MDATTRIVGRFRDEASAAGAAREVEGLGLEVEQRPLDGAAQDTPSPRRAAIGAVVGVLVGAVTGVVGYLWTRFTTEPLGREGVAHGGMLLVYLGVAIVFAGTSGALIGFGLGRGRLGGRRDDRGGGSVAVLSVAAPRDRVAEVRRLLEARGADTTGTAG